MKRKADRKVQRDNWPASPAERRGRFQRASTSRIKEMLETLSALGQVTHGPDGRYRV